MSKPTPKVTHIVAVVLVTGAVLLLLFDGGARPQGAAPAASYNEYAGEDPPAGQDVVALFDGLKPGDELAGQEVLAIDAPSKGLVLVDVQAGDAVFSIGVEKNGNNPGSQPPITTESYDIGYGNLRGKGEPPAGALGNAAEALAQRIRKRERDVPVPAGM